MHLQNDPAQWVIDQISEFVGRSPQNRMTPGQERKAFDEPLVGFSSGADALYDEYVRHIGDFYLTPVEVYRKAFPQAAVPKGQELTVISWILPQTEETCTDQAGQTKHPARSWAQVRYHGEAFNNSLRKHVVAGLKANGINAVAPMLADFWKRYDQGPYAPCGLCQVDVPCMKAIPDPERITES